MKAIYIFLVLTLAFAASPLNAQSLTEQSSTDSAGSEVRIVRLSQVRGKAQMDRGVGAGFEMAFANLPVVQGSKLETTDGSAEVEFEDNSTLRLTPGTLVEFATLDRSSSGITNSKIHVVRGTVYADLQKTKGNTFALESRGGAALISPHSIVRLTAEYSQDDLSVFDGEVTFQSPGSGSVLVGRMKELVLDPVLQAKASFVTKLTPEPSDSWEGDERAFHDQYSKAATLSGSPYLYGVTDLNYYGSFADLPGCGRVWRPYFASATWDPYSTGVWAWYPTGYSWVSPYPWGWAPFHYGTWQQCTAGLWGWAPGGTWRGLRNANEPAPSPNQSAKPGLRLHSAPAQPQPPLRGDIKMMLASTRPTPVSSINPDSHAFIFRNDSAGLGVPRKTFGELSKLSTTTGQSGTATIPMYAVRSWTTRTTPAEGEGKTQAQRTPVTIWVPANDPRVLQAANNTNDKNKQPDAIAGSNQIDFRPSDRIKGSPEFRSAMAGTDGSDAHNSPAMSPSTRKLPTPITAADGSVPVPAAGRSGNNPVTH